jgi:hypothetical protein
MAQQHHRPRNFGGIRFPDQGEPPPGPLSRLASELAQQRADDGGTMSPAVRGLLADLPSHLRTQVLQKRYMHVLEKVAQRWDSPRALRQLFEDLVFESRRQGSGLSFDAIVELTELNDYIKRVKFRERPSVWDEALGLV